jgi:uncharacterized membrane protein YeaQ/YmgE (transglycosylase-associated protein family)
MNWIDLLCLVIIGGTTALAAKRGLGGLIIGAGALVFFTPLLGVARLSPLLALALALMLGLLLGFVGRHIARRNVPVGPLYTALGGVGGFLLGTTLTLSLAVSLPLERDINNLLVYPPRTLAAPISNALQSSQFALMGRNILLYPLLDAAGQIAPEQRGVLSALHRFLVFGRPWEGG